MTEKDKLDHIIKQNEQILYNQQYIMGFLKGMNMADKATNNTIMNGFVPGKSLPQQTTQPPLKTQVSTTGLEEKSL